MENTTTYVHLRQHPVLCAEAFCHWVQYNHGLCPSKDPARLRKALRELLGQPTTAERATFGGDYQGLAQLLLRADIYAHGLLGQQTTAAYDWLRIRWREPQPPPLVAQAWKVGIRQLISWARYHCREPQSAVQDQDSDRLQQAA